MFENLVADKVAAEFVLINHLYKYKYDVLFITSFSRNWEYRPVFPFS
jgi:hypothetical protein